MGQYPFIMGRIKILLIVFVCTVTLSFPNRSYAEMSPKVKAFLLVSAYGTVGGALLGFATLAFGTNPRAIAQGASLGLYAGMIFGGYVVSTHNNGEEYSEEEEAYPESTPPPAGGGYAPFGNPNPANPSQEPAPEENSGGGFFGGGRVMHIQNDISRTLRQTRHKKGTLNAPPIYIPLFHSSF